jgi:putative transposase
VSWASCSKPTAASTTPCLDQRKPAYEAERRSVRYAEQSAWHKAQRASNPFFARLNFNSAQATMRRLDKAFQNYFRRVKEGAAEPGYPRFKSRDRFNSIEFPAHGNGFASTAVASTSSTPARSG